MKERTRRIDIDVNRESDGVILPEKQPNKAIPVAAEVVEVRTPAKRNAGEKATDQTQSWAPVSCGLEGVRRRAMEDKTCCFTALLHHITPELLRESFYKLNRKAEDGIDSMSWEAYEEELEERLPKLHEEIHKGSYRAKPVKRVYIPKGKGQKRPLGITAIEDKLVQQAVVTVLNEIYETEFYGFSYGYRQGRGPENALDALATAILKRPINWILDADLQEFFDSIPHDKLMEAISIRVGDKRILRLIGKWLKTGYIEDGKRYRQKAGTSQGSVISPLLANIYLHYVVDEWVEQERRRRNNGEVIIIRYADDLVMGFQYKTEAERYLEALSERVQAYGLKLHPEKTCLKEFGRYAEERMRKRGEGKPEGFDFLGFTHLCSRNRKGGYFLKRKTKTKKLRQKLSEIKVQLRKRKHAPIEQTGKWLKSVVQGFGLYFGVPGNSRSLRSYRDQVVKMWLRILRRRSQKGRALTWEKFNQIVEKYIPHLRICQPFPEVRFAMTQGRSRMR
jgi:group II intron reverse transcriptase/maturase